MYELFQLLLVFQHPPGVVFTRECLVNRFESSPPAPSLFAPQGDRFSVPLLSFLLKA